jgi:signal peptidase I
MSTMLPNPVSPAPEPVVARPRPATRSAWLSAFQSLIKTIIVAVFVITFIVQAFRIPSASMQNTLMVGDYLLVDKEHFGSTPLLAPLFPYRRIQRNDIIVFRFPVDPNQLFVKRAIGLPGDRIKLIHSVVFVNGKPLNEPYALHKPRLYDAYNNDFPNGRYVHPNVEARWYNEMHKLITDQGELIVPEGNYFVLGDNRDDSDDSRYWGFVPRENVLGRPLMIYFSLNQDPAFTEASLASDKVMPQLAFLLKHIPETVRWNRCLHMVF